MARKKKGKRPSDARLYGGIAALAVFLGAIVVWSLPGDTAAPVEDGGSAHVADEDTGRTRLDALPRPPAASAELAVVTDLDAEALKALATPAEIGRRLEARHCGDACDAVRKFMTDEDGFDAFYMTTDDLILPPKDTLETVAPGLTPAEREGLHARPHAMVLRTTGKPTREQLPARTAFAAAAVLAEAAHGYVYDETERKIETAADFARHLVTAPLGQNAFEPRHIVVQLYRQDDGTARLLTLGMVRFGAPDLSLRGANMASGPLLAEVLNAAAAKIAGGHDESTLAIGVDDVARVMGRKPAEVNAGDGRSVLLEISEPERMEGDPDNDLAELTPPGGIPRDGWDVVVASLFGQAPTVTSPVDDKELGEIAKRARRDLPKAIARFEAAGGALYVKGPFPIPEDQRLDGGPTVEHLWIAARACDAQRCTGSLSNEPSYLSNLAAGKTTSVSRAEVADFLLQQKDGGTMGGESIKALKARR